MRALPPPSAFQFERTRPLRLALYREARLAARRRVLEVGAGEGPVAAEVALRTCRPVLALDRVAPSSHPVGVRFVLGDAFRLPFRSGSLDAVLLHFVLLWLPRPVEALAEIRRVLGKSGALLLLAEPDLTGREDRPDTGLGRTLERAVRSWGGHPDAGLRAEGWLRDAGFRPHLRATPAEWLTLSDPRETLAEVDALRRGGLLEEHEARALADREEEAFASGPRRVRLRITYGWAERS